MATGLFNVAPSLSRCNSIRFLGKGSGVSETQAEQASRIAAENLHGWTGNIVLMMELRTKILIFRDVIDLPPCDHGSNPIHELVMGTVEDLHNLYPKVVSQPPPETQKISMEQALALLYNALKCIGDSWAKNHKWIEKENMGQDSEDSLDNMISLEQIGEAVVSKLKHTTLIARQMFDVMDEDERRDNKAGVGIQGFTIGDALTESYCDTKHMTCPSPDTPTSVPPPELSEIADTSYYKSLLLPFRLKALENLKPVGIRHLFSFNISPHTRTNEARLEHDIPSSASNPTPSPPPPLPSSPPPSQGRAKPPPPPPNSSPPPAPPPPPPKGTATPPPPPPPPPFSSPSPAAPPPPPPKGTATGAPPPPPPLGAAKALRPKKATTKLKRSSHMGSLYRTLKGKVEGSSLNGKHGKGKRSHIGGASAGGKKGMADALAEMTKRSAYFQQIEEDVEKHSKSILEIKSAINSFQTKDMSELVKFHKYVEHYLEKLTDETQVLGRFEGFPTKKLESLRTATALYLKLEEMVNTLKNWKVVPPLGQQIDKVESFFNKIKGEIDALERTKDEESKRFQSHNITFDFNILVRIKESMVDVSSSCMELALEERQNTKMLWRAFELAFRVYSFAGGQDERADMLTKELALEIQKTDHSVHA